MAMMATTIMTSISVNPRVIFFIACVPSGAAIRLPNMESSEEGQGLPTGCEASSEGVVAWLC